jgi:N-acetylmuramic acid 6-phosphate etherase
VPLVGPEVITGSTRMKAGTAQKMVLNMISTVAMIRLGYVKGNRMTNVKPSNIKLKERSLRILMAETGLDEEPAVSLMKHSGGDLRVAIFIHRTNSTPEEARDVLAENNYIIDRAVEAVEESTRDRG